MTLAVLLGWLAGSALAAPVDLNTATVEELDALPGLGRSKATAIVVHRERYGRFPTVDTLQLVSGIGPGTFRAIRYLVVVRDEPVSTDLPQPPANESRHPAVPSTVSVDPNTASVVELAALPGISGPRAEAIVADRERNGRFEDCADLVRVQGIGPATVAALRALCEVK